MVKARYTKPNIKQQDGLLDNSGTNASSRKKDGGWKLTLLGLAMLLSAIYVDQEQKEIAAYFNFDTTSVSSQIKAAVGVDNGDEDASSSTEVAIISDTTIDDPPTTTEPPSGPTHVFFLGDSLLRYSYMEWLDYHHFQRSTDTTPPHTDLDLLINEKRHDSWVNYFHYSTDHFEGKMRCDCRRDQEFNLGHEVENRYYANLDRSFWATYIQGYGQNSAKGRYNPRDIYPDLPLEISGEEDQTPYKWAWPGERWDWLLLKHAGQLQPKPTAVVFNAGLWPDMSIGLKLERIFRAAREVVGWHPDSRIIWRCTNKLRDHGLQWSNADVQARDWIMRMPGVTLLEFPQELAEKLTPDDYFDDKHYAKASVYRQWNEDLRKALAPTIKKNHRVFILVGAVRTLRMTEDTILQNWILPLCPPSTCVAHLVTHFSYTDNRPSKGNDPTGQVVAGSSADEQFFQNHNFPEGYLMIHPVEHYNIGSQQEQDAMDLVEQKEFGDPARLRMFRLGDPRRFSMWFARAWAWRHVKLHIATQYKVDFFCLWSARSLLDGPRAHL